ncbi:class I SAM-dependent methyltransferase [Parasphingopyxis sp.]|uniref:class I SAM-dependent methyltransferase n=1 Tax=Parasphingopyxis sp. TaxID=1920299 RepID=UPI0026201D93|nr:class I SAM-dependent methyltransferase [Parasphingopyxis sp.]
MFSDLAHYLENEFEDVQGWCIPQLWQSIEPLARAMRSDGDAGPVAEIGVYHGKFFIGLAKTMGAKAHNTAIDVFSMQEFNLDGAGKGDEAVFRNNLEQCGISEATDLIEADSMGLSDDDAAALRAKTGGFSMFSVDGCHTAEHTVNDLEFALKVIRRDGIIFIDDYNNANWPGVQEGIAKHYFGGSRRFVPVLYSCNKLLLCNLSFHDRYIETVLAHLKEHFPDTRCRDHARFGYRCLSIFSDTADGAVLSRV